MKARYFNTSLLLIFLLAVFTVILIWAQEYDQPQTKTQTGIDTGSEHLERLDDVSSAFTGFVQQKLKGDLEAMIERRFIRVLVTYNRTHFFVDKGTQLGIIHDLLKQFEEDLNRKLENRHIRVNVVFIPVARDELETALLEGMGDIAAANLTITPAREKNVDFTDPLMRDVKEIPVTGPDGPVINTPDDLSGKEVYVRRSSSFYESLAKLNKELKKAGKKPAIIVPAPEELETEDILEMVNANLVQITIADDHLAEFWKQIFENITLHPEAAIKTGRDIAMMVRKDSPMLKEELNEFIARYPKGSLWRNIILQKYLQDTRHAREMTSPEEMARFEAMVDIFKRYGDIYQMDHLLMLAQGYQESRLDQSARSPAGAIGVMQLLQSTGQEMNVGDINQLEPNIHAGIKYVRSIKDHYFSDENLDPLNRMLLAIAAYNAGPSRISRLRRETAERGLNPGKWFNNVEVIVAERIGRETVQYVSNIYKYYLAYNMVMEQAQRREEVKVQVLH